MQNKNQINEFTFDMLDLIEHIPGGVAIYKFTLPIEVLYYNQGVCNLSGHTSEEYIQVVKHNALDIVYEADRASLEEEIFSSVAENRKIDYTYRIYHKNGSLVWIHLSAIKVRVEDGIPIYHALFMDISDERKIQKVLIERAQHDSLTGALNRISFENKVEACLSEKERTSAFIMLDIDDFKNINDKYGHLTGDDALSLVSNHLFHIFGADHMISRMGGDEFAVFAVYENEEALLDKIYEIANLNMDNKLHNIHLSCSIGVALFPKDGEDFNTLYANADKALLFAKNNGKNQFQMFSEFMEPNNRKLFQNMEWLLDEGVSAIYICNAKNYELLYMNKLGRNMAGVHDNSYIGKKCYQCLMHLKDPCPFCKMDEMGEDEFNEREFQVPHTKQDLILKGKFINWNGIHAHVEFITDNSDRAIVSRKLKKTVNDLQGLMQHIPNAIAILEIQHNDLRMTYLNKGFYKLVNCSKEHEGMYAGAMKEWVHPDDLIRLAEQIQQAVKEKCHLDCTFQMLLSTGDYQRMKVHATLLQQANDQITMYGSFSIE